MKRQIIYFLLLLSGESVRGQATYEKLWLAVGLAPLTMNVLPSQRILVNLQYGPGASVMDASGNLVETSHYWNDHVGGVFNIRQRSANEYFFVTEYITSDSCLNNIHQRYPAIGRMDSLGNVLEVRYYIMGDQGCENNPKDLEVTNDGGVIAWGRNNNFFALRTDAAGIPLWGKSFGYTVSSTEPFGRRGGFQFIRELPGGDLLAGINMDSAGVVVARMDASGDFLWCRSFIRPGGMIHDCLIESDDSIIITGATDTIASTNTMISLPPEYHPKLFMMKLDGQGEVQWCKGYDSAPNIWYSRGGSRIEKTNDGNYILLATLGVEGYNLGYRPFLAKIDLNGDTIWTRSAGVNGYTYTGIDLLAASDGGFIYNGEITGSVGPWSGGAFTFKTDSLGHLPCSERWSSITISDLFPVDSSFTLSSTDGITMHQISVSDTTFAPILVYDGCTFTGLVGSTIRKEQQLHIRPNPNTGRFTVQFADPLLAESYYSVYDTMGKLLVQRRLPTGATVQEVDLARYGAGTYVVKFTSPNGVCHERVVVE